MFYCEDCGTAEGWPTHDYLTHSRGACEMCGQRAVCLDIPSTYLDAFDAEREVAEAIESIAQSASKAER